MKILNIIRLVVFSIFLICCGEVYSQSSQDSINLPFIDFQNPVFIFGFTYQFKVNGLNPIDEISVYSPGASIIKYDEFYSICAYYKSEIIVSKKQSQTDSIILFKKRYNVHKPEYYVSINGINPGGKIEVKELNGGQIFISLVNLDVSFNYPVKKYFAKAMKNGRLQTIEIEGQSINDNLSDFVTDIPSGSPIIFQFVLSYSGYSIPVWTPEYVYYKL